MCQQHSQQPKSMVIQDTTHIGTKLRNRLLKPAVNLAMGDSRVSINHLKALVKNIQKSVHGLSNLDVIPVDRMNFGSFEKIVHERVIDALKQHVSNSEATIKYLNICKDVTSSFLQLDLMPLERIFKIWQRIYFLRIWRCFIMASKTYTLKDNFITSNAYSCIEINARNLIWLIKKFRDQNTPEQFLPTLFDSQSCEKAFGQFRSMGTTHYTKVNFSLYELLFMIGRVEVQNEISYFKLKDTGISFPYQRVGKTKIYPLPSDIDINATLARAKETAIIEAAKFGMSETANIDDFEIVSNLSINNNEDEFSDDDTGVLESTHEFDCENDDDEFQENMNLSENLNENSPLTVVYDENGVKRIVRRSMMVWMLCEPIETLSNDRLRRVQINQKIRKIDDS